MCVYFIILGKVTRNRIIMTSLKPFTCFDLFKFNKVNFDPLTETYALSFYMTYMARWPDYFKKIENTRGDVVGYSKFNQQCAHSFQKCV